MRQSLSIALNHTAQRKAFGKPLIEQPLMRNVLADLAIESKAACAIFIRLARCFDYPFDAHEQALSRLLTAGLPLLIEDMAPEPQARRPAQDIALALQAALLYQTALNAVAVAFCDSRLGGHWGQTFGTLPADHDFSRMIERFMPH